MPVQWRGSSPDELRYGDPIGPPATITREPGQIRKEAATAGTLCAGVWLVGSPPISKSLVLQGFLAQKFEVEQRLGIPGRVALGLRIGRLFFWRLLSWR